MDITAMALIDAANIKTLTDRLGASELSLATARDIDTSNSAMERLAAARDYVYDSGTTLNGEEFDNILALASSMRGSEKTLVDYLETALDDSVTALDAYFVSTVATGLRAYYTGLTAPTTVSWDTNFKNLWRRVKSEEIIIALATSSRSAGTWTPTYDADGIELASAVEVRPETLIGSSAITVTCVLNLSGGGTATIGVSIPAGTATDTAFPVQNSTYTTFVGVTSMTVTGGTNGESVKLWLSV